MPLVSERISTWRLSSHPILLGLSGIEFCNAALSQGYKLTIYVRNPDKIPDDISGNANVSVETGTLDDISSFQQAACSGPTVFVSFAGPVMSSKGTVCQISLLSTWVNTILTNRIACD